MVSARRAEGVAPSSAEVERLGFRPLSLDHPRDGWPAKRAGALFWRGGRTPEVLAGLLCEIDL